MAQSINKVNQMLETSLKALTRKDRFISYLNTSNHMYKYSFQDSLLIYAQNPNATAVASYELWNDKLRRYINAGTSGIALLRTNSRKSNIKYVFDIADTHGGKSPYIWQLQDEYIEPLSAVLTDKYSLDGSPSFEQVIDKVIDSYIKEDSDYLNTELRYRIEGSFLEEVDELNTSVWLDSLLRDSIKTVVMLRCGYDLDDIFIPNDFLHLENFNTPETMIFLGSSISQYSQTILREIEKQVKPIRKQYTLERRIDNERAKNDNQRDANQVRSNQSGLDETTARTDGAGSTTTREARDDAQDMPGETSQDRLHHNVDTGQAIQDVPPETSQGTGADRHEDSPDEEIREQPITLGDTIRRDREPSNQGDNTKEIKQSDIDKVLLNGTQFDSGKQGIIDFFFENKDPEKRAGFVKSAYGIGGDSIQYADDRFGFYSYEESGLDIDRGEQYDDLVYLSWTEVAQHIDTLIQSNKYYEPQHDGELLIKPSPPPQTTLFDYEQDYNIDDKGANGKAPFLVQENSPSDIDYVLLGGSGFQDGKQRIIDFYFKEHTNKEFLSFLKDEYGTGGATADYPSGRHGYHGHDGKGIKINYFDSDDEDITLSWSKVAKGIGKLIENEQYFELRYLNDTPLVHPVKDAEQPDTSYRQFEKGQRFQVTPNSIVTVDWVNRGTNEVKFINDDGLSNIRSLDIAEKEFNDKNVFEDEIQAENTNFIITDNQLGHGGAKEKYQHNVNAITLLKAIESENKTASTDEQAILSQYVGFGGIADAFDSSKDNWSKEYSELQELLTSQEYESARASTLSSFYTHPVIIRSIYKAIEGMGFSKGNILEPAMGTGNFIGCMPDSMKSSKVYGVELDNLTGRIAKQLYPNSNIQITGFEKTQFPDNFFDISIGNVPFGDFGVSDSRYDKHKFMIHDYFFAKSLDKVRAGGVVAFITSKGTLDKASPRVRQYLAQRADLIGAIRLPNTAFKENAGTAVTSDIIFLKKRDNIQDISPSWVGTGLDDSGIPMNQYFVDNPHMILGTMEKVVGRFGEEYVCLPSEDATLEAQLATAIEYINVDMELTTEIEIDEPEQEDTIISANPDVKNYSFTIHDDDIYFRENSTMRLVDVSKTADERIRGLISIRTVLHQVIDNQVNGLPDEQIQSSQQQLNMVYDEFIKAYERITTRANSLAFREDSSYYLLSSLEILDEKQRFKEKADIFTKQTIRPVKEITYVDTASEALALSLSNKGYVDIGYMASLTSKKPMDVINNLKGIIFKDPRSDMDNLFEGWKTADEYLSGNVRDKLRIANEYGTHELTHNNVQYLTKVQPQDLTFDEIDVKIGTVWIPPRDYFAFIHETLKTPNYYRFDIEVKYSSVTGEWNISSKNMNSDSTLASATYGTDRKSAYHIIENALNLRSTKVYDRVIDDDGKVRSVQNKKETLLASQKQTLLQEEFKTWVWKDPERRERLSSYYNEHFNNTRPREYDGSHLVFYGMNPSIELRPHQKNAIARQLYGKNSLLAHVVGAGKSFTMIAGAMEKKRLGLSTKNMFVVPNHLTEQMATEILRLYPSANVLVTTKRDFQTSNRKRFCSKIATGEYDIVIIGHSQFEKIPLSVERQTRLISLQIEEITSGITEIKYKDGQRFNIKQMESTKKKLEVRLEKLNKNERKDDVITFEQIGVDGLYVDESHMYKNLFMYTKMNNVAGIQQTEAQKSTDMFMKCQYMDEITNGTGICFATGTPISNSMVEMYTVQRYLQMKDLKDRGLSHFDSWASVFGEQQTAFELSVDGNGFKTKTRFNKFHNLPELMNMFKEVADIQTADMLNLPVPKLRTGQVQNILIKPTDIQRMLIKGLGDRAEKIDRRLVTPDIDNMLKITGDGRKIALDQRLYNPLLPDDHNSKVNHIMQNVHDIWQRTEVNRSTQIVFCDMSTPNKKGGFNVYDDLKQKWIDKGIPEHEIAFIQDTKNDVQKKSLFDKVRNGDVRILIGSTQMMGSGTNLQDKLIALHHADVPWRPSDLAQREGRILRQGNENDEVEIFRYITEETFDAYSYQLIEQKQKFISQVMTSKSPARSAEDVDDKALSYAEVKALATGNPAIKEKMKLDFEVTKLKLFKNQFINNKYSLENKLNKTIPTEIARYEELISNYTKDIAIIQTHDTTDFTINLKGIQYDDKAKAGVKIIELCANNMTGVPLKIGTYKGFKLSTMITEFGSVKLTIAGNSTHTIDLGSDPHGNITRIDNAIKAIPDRLYACKQKLEILHNEVNEIKIEVAKVFPQEDELREKLVRLEELNHELAMDRDEDDVEVEEKSLICAKSFNER